MRRRRPPATTDPYPAVTLVNIVHIVYGMGTVSARLPEELEEELEAYLDAERLDRSTAVRRLLEAGLEEWRRDLALERLAEGEATLSRAAELAGMDVWSFASLARERDVAWVAEDRTREDLEDV